MHTEIDRYYRESFDDVNYAGLSGWATRRMHRALEEAAGPQVFFPRVLELGCGQGEHLQFVRHGFDEYVLSDLEDRGLDLAALSRVVPPAAGARRLSFEQADATQLPFPDASFDRTVHVCLLHHLADPEAALREMRRVLRRGGLATIYLPCDPGALYLLTRRLTTARRVGKALRDGNYSITQGYLRAKEHPNHYASLQPLIEEVFKADRVDRRDFPFGRGGYQANYFTAFQVRVA